MKRISAFILFLFIIFTFIIITCSLPPKTLPNSDSGIDTADTLDVSIDSNQNNDTIHQDIEEDNKIDTNDIINIDISNDEIDVATDNIENDTIEDLILADGSPCEPCLPDETCNPETGKCEKEGYSCSEIFSCVMENGAEEILTCAEGGSADGRRKFGSLVACLMEECFNEFIGGNEMEIFSCASNNCSEQLTNCMF